MANLELERRLRAYGHPVWTAGLVVFNELSEWEEHEKKWRETVPDSREHQEHEESLIEIVERISSWNFLMYLYSRSELGSSVNIHVVTRMEEVLSILLPTITDFFVLYKMWSEILPSIWPFLQKVDAMIRVRMKELIGQVTVDDCPVWFLLLLEADSALCPVQASLNAKVSELKTKLNIS
jgi:hypothetical protein